MLHDWLSCNLSSLDFCTCLARSFTALGLSGNFYPLCLFFSVIYLSFQSAHHGRQCRGGGFPCYPLGHDPACFPVKS